MGQNIDEYLTTPEHAAINHAGIPGVGFPTGVVIDYAGNTPPAGFLLCDGTSYPTATYPALFAAIGYLWGGAGPNFNVPSLNRRTTVGSGGAGSGVLGNTVGSVGGEETHTQTVAEMATHGHTNSGTHNHNDNSGNGAVVATGNPLSLGFIPDGVTPYKLAIVPHSAAATGTQTSVNGANISINNNGSSTPANVMQPSAVMNKIISI